MLAFKEKVYNATLELENRNLALWSWGNVSAVDRKAGIMVIKPHKMSFSELRPGDMVVMSLDGKVLDGKREPSYDAATHLVLYNNFPKIGAIVHTHSIWATCRAQAGVGIPPVGATHADRFCGEIPCTRPLSDAEIKGDYEKETGNLIVETFKNIDYMKIPAVLVYQHGPFIWGSDIHSALMNASLLEEIAKMASYTMLVNPNAEIMSEELIKRHHQRSADR
jgi:L-ribulose-5-phosphate 4-epimerase